jgi:hypothetical protein
MNTPVSNDSEALTRDPEARIEEIVQRGPHGAIALAGAATAIVFALWFAFYFLVFLPRGVVQ